MREKLVKPFPYTGVHVPKNVTLFSSQLTHHGNVYLAAIVDADNEASIRTRERQMIRERANTPVKQQSKNLSETFPNGSFTLEFDSDFKIYLFTPNPFRRDFRGALITPDGTRYTVAIKPEPVIEMYYQGLIQNRRVVNIWVAFRESKTYYISAHQKAFKEMMWNEERNQLPMSDIYNVGTIVETPYRTEIYLGEVYQRWTTAQPKVSKYGVDIIVFDQPRKYHAFMELPDTGECPSHLHSSQYDGATFRYIHVQLKQRKPKRYRADIAKPEEYKEYLDEIRAISDVHLMTQILASVTNGELDMEIYNNDETHTQHDQVYGTCTDMYNRQLQILDYNYQKYAFQDQLAMPLDYQHIADRIAAMRKDHRCSVNANFVITFRNEKGTILNTYTYAGNTVN